MHFSNVGLNSLDSTELLVLLVVILFIILLWNSWKTAKRYADLPTSFCPLFDGIYEFLSKKLKSLNSIIFQQLDAICKQFEKEGMVHIWCFRHILIVFGEEPVKVFVTDEASADKAADYVIIKEGFGEGLVTSNGETWKKDRKLLNPVFHIGKLKQQIPTLNENANILVKKLAYVADKPTADLLPFLGSCALHNVCESILDINIKEKVREIEIEEFFKVVKWLQKYMISRWIVSPSLAKLHKLCTPYGWKSVKMYQKAKQFVLKIISPEIESFIRKSRDLGKDLDLNRKSLLHILLEHQLKNPSFTSQHFQDHIYTIVAAGSDTIAFTMMWCLYLLGQYKDVQEKAYSEIQSVADEFVTYEHLCQLKYLDCIIKETLRLYPTITTFGRHLKKDVQCGKYTVPKDTTILFFLYRLHKNPEIYPDPENFDPDRFRSTNTEKRKWAYLPFSEGHRSCIGKKFSMLEMKVTLAYILRNYEITSLDRREDLDLCWNFVLMPARSLRMRITPRQRICEVP